jgi:hypothetical protein
MKNTHRLLLFLLTISLLFISAGASHQALAQAENEPEGFKAVRLLVYPEFDDPRLLVMLRGEIVGAEAPVKVRFLVPATAEMYFTGAIDAAGQYFPSQPQREPSAIPGWDEISYELTTDIFLIEYYDPIIIGQSDKTISYEYRWLHPISHIHVMVQEPRQSSNFSVSPAGRTSTGDEGFTYHMYDYYDLDDEPPLGFAITYTKSNPLPSLAIEKESTNTALIVITVVGLCALIAAGFIWVKKSRPKAGAERRRAAKSAPVREPTEKRLPRRFCDQCGQSLEESSRFCSYCGTKLP